MPVNLKACEITSSGKTIAVRTAKGRLAYPHVFKPNTQTNDDGTTTTKYSTSLVFPKGTDLSELNRAIDLAAEAKFGKDWKREVPRLRRPILNTAEYPKMGFPADDFPNFIRTSADPEFGEIGVADHQPMKLTEKDAHEVYAGRWALLTINVRAYDRKGNRGVGLYLNNVQVLEHGEKLSGGRADPMTEFQAIDISDSADAIFGGGAKDFA